MSRRRRFTVGRAFALLILGFGIGAALFLMTSLRPESLKQEVLAALDELLIADFEVDDVEIGLDTGVVVSGLRVFYPDRTEAMQVERVVLTVDHKQLLGGEVSIRKVDFHGMKLRLTRPAGVDAPPGLPGIFRERETEADEPMLPATMPLVEIYPGDTGSWVEIVNPRMLVKDTTVRLDCLHAEARADGPLFRVEGEFSGRRVDRFDVRIVFDPVAQTLRVDAETTDVRWKRDDIKELSPKTRELLPPVEMGGRADASVGMLIDLADGEIETAEATAHLHELEGVFGDIYTGARVGLPFGVRQGTGVFHYADGRVTLDDFSAVYVSPAGIHGKISASVAIRLDGIGVHLDVAAKGEGVEGTTEDLRHLLPPGVVEGMVNNFLPGGTFDFDLKVSQRPAHEEKVIVDLVVRNGGLDYAGHLDKLTGKRFGFRYPLERCHGRFHIATNVPTARGFADLIEVRELRGYSPIARPPPNGPDDVAFTAQGRLLLYNHTDGVNREDHDIRVKIEDLPIDGKLARAFASTQEGNPYQNFELTGWAPKVKIHIQRDGFVEAEARSMYDVELNECSIAYREFPLHIQNVTGRIISQDLRPDEEGRYSRRLEFMDFRGDAADGGGFSASGHVRQYDDDTEEIKLNIHADSISVGADLERALLASSAAGTGFMDVWRRLRPSGAITADLEMDSANMGTIKINLSELSLGGYEEIDCPITDLGGAIRYKNGVVTLDAVTGRILDQATFHIGGVIKPDGAIDLSGEVDQLVLGEAVRRILRTVAPEADATVASLQLSEESAFDVVLHIERANRNADLDLRVTIDDIDAKSSIFGFDLGIRGGPIELGTNAVLGKDLWLRAGDGELRIVNAHIPHDPAAPLWAILDAKNLKPGGHLDKVLGADVREILGKNLRIDLTGFRAEYRPVDSTLILSGALDLRRYELLAAAPGALEPTGQVGFTPLTLRLPDVPGGTLSYSGVIDFKHFNMNLPVGARDMSGQVRVAEGTIAPEFTLKGAVSDGSVTLWDRKVEDMALNLTYTPRYFHLGNIDGHFYKGNFRGDVEVHLADPGAFRVQLHADNVELGEMLKEDLPRTEPMSGTLKMVIDVESASGEPEHMQGRAQVRVANGQLFRVPGLRRVLSVLSRVTPISDNRFERAEIDLDIDGELLTVEKFHFSTKLNDIHGYGDISIYGDLNLVVEPQVTRAIDLPRLVDIPVLSSLANIFYSTVYEIRLEGTIDSPALRLRGLPFIKDKRRRFTQSPHAGRAERIRPRLLP